MLRRIGFSRGSSSSATSSRNTSTSSTSFNSSTSNYSSSSSSISSFQYLPVATKQTISNLSFTISNQMDCVRNFTSSSSSTTTLLLAPKNTKQNTATPSKEENDIDDLLVEKISSTSSEHELDRLTFELLSFIENIKSLKELSDEEKNEKLSNIIDENLVDVVTRNISDFRLPFTSVRYLSSIIAELCSPLVISSSLTTEHQNNNNNNNNNNYKKNNQHQYHEKACDFFLNKQETKIEYILLLMLERCGNNHPCITEICRAITALAAHSPESARRFATKSNLVGINVLNFALLKQTHLAPASSARLLYQGRGTARYCVEAMANVVITICKTDTSNSALELFLAQNTFEPIFEAFLKFETCDHVCALLALLIGDNEGSVASTQLRKKHLTNLQFVERITFLLHKRVLTSSDVTNVSALIVSLCHDNLEVQNMFASSHFFGRALVNSFPIAFMNIQSLKSLVSAITSLFGSSKDFSTTAKVLVYFPRLIDLLLYSVTKSIKEATLFQEQQKQQQQNQNQNQNHEESVKMDLVFLLSTKSTPAVGALLHSMASLCALADGLPCFDDDEHDLKHAGDRKILELIRTAVNQGVEFLSKNVEDFKEIDERSDVAWRVMKESKTGRQILFKIVREVFV